MRARKTLIIGVATVAVLAAGTGVAAASTTQKVCQFQVTRNAPILVKNAQGQAVLATAPKDSIANISAISSVNGRTFAGGNFYHRIVTRAPGGQPAVTHRRYATGAVIDYKDLRSLDHCWRQ